MTRSRVLSICALMLGVGCGGSEAIAPIVPDPITGIPAAQKNKGCAGAVTTFPSFAPSGASPAVISTGAFRTLGRGDFKPGRTSAEVAVRGNHAYTTTWGNKSADGSAVYVWNVQGNALRLVDSITVSFATTLGDIAVSDDGTLLVVATERANGSIVIFSLSDPAQPKLITCFLNDETTAGVHTAEIGRVNGQLYAFLSIDPSGTLQSKLVTVDLGTPAAPKQVFSQFIGRPYVHDTFVRDGLLFLGLWNDGVAIWDIGGGGRGGTVTVPVELSRLQTANGEVHNIWWMKDPVTGTAKYAFIGEEGPGSIPSSSVGDVHVVDVSNLSNPTEVAFYNVPGAGTHNFSVDEPNRILYAAYYNGGVRALDVAGDLGTCTAGQRSTPANSTRSLCDLRKMGREVGVGLLDQATPVYIWGVQFLNGSVYASDMVNGIWKLGAVARP